MHQASLSQLLLIDRQIGDGILTKVNGNPLPNSPEGKRCLLVMCGDMRHRKDVQDFFERKLGANLHLLKLPGGALELSPRSPRNKRYPGDFTTRMRDVARAIAAQDLNHISLVSHFECGAATLDGLGPIGVELLIKDAKQAIIRELAQNADLRSAVNGVNFWRPGEQDISCFLHCFTGELPLTKHIQQERTAWFITHQLPDWAAQHYPETVAQLLA